MTIGFLVQGSVAGCWRLVAGTEVASVSEPRQVRGRGALSHKPDSEDDAANYRGEHRQERAEEAADEAALAPLRSFLRLRPGGGAEGSSAFRDRLRRVHSSTRDTGSGWAS